MKIQHLRPASGAVKRPKIVGKGPGSGHGKTATRGNKGQNSRTGGGVRLGFEGGQTPIYRKLPIRGFKAPSKLRFSIINVEQLSIFENGATVTPSELKGMGLIGGNEPVKILGNGDLKIKLIVRAHAFSSSALEKIKAAGGIPEVL
jgi:large subunit ribosomal protein L15